MEHPEHSPLPLLKLQDSPPQPTPSRASRPLSSKKHKTWTKDELYLLAAFFHFNHWRFQSEEQKKRWKIYKSMSAFIGSKNINQCRTYSNKLLKTFKTVPKINAFFRTSLPLYDSIIPTLEQKNINLFGNLPQDSSSSDECSHDSELQNINEDHLQCQRDQIKEEQKEISSFEVIVPQASYPTGVPQKLGGGEGEWPGPDRMDSDYFKWINNLSWQWWAYFNRLAAAGPCF